MPFFVEIQSWTQKKAQISKIFGRNPPKWKCARIGKASFWGINEVTVYGD
jgi:hypothetical protein